MRIAIVGGGQYRPRHGAFEAVAGTSSSQGSD